VRQLKLAWGDSGRIFDIDMVDDSGAALNDSSSWGMLCYKLCQAVPGCFAVGCSDGFG
jgi:hypothetical protein